VHARPRHPLGEARDEIQRLEHDVRGAVAIRGLQLVAHLALRGEREPGRGEYLHRPTGTSLWVMKTVTGAVFYGR
jgi:hypothetical protein